MSEEKTHPFGDDRPICTKEEDKLDRSKFVEEFTKAVNGWKGKDSLVIAINGDWGAGKTSIKNLMIEEAKEHNSSPIIMDFNPWQRAGKFDLIEIFFTELAILLGKQDKKDKYEDLAKKVKKYRKYFTAGKSMVSVIRKVLLAIIVVVSLAATILSWHVAEKPLSSVHFWGVFVLLLASGALSFFEGLFKDITSFYEELTEIHKKSLNDVKKELEDALKSIKRPILVIVDDLDRLTPDEVKTVLQLVKANADFPNIIYILLFQRTVIEKAIKIYSHQEGREYLEKIVQVGINIPEIDRVKLEKILFQKLDEMLSHPYIDPKFEQDRWQELFIPGLRPFFGNMRDVNRFVSTLHFHIECFKGESTFEVNPVDLIAMEVLRVFEPDVYRAITLNKHLLTEKISKDEKEQSEKALEEIVAISTKGKDKPVRHILSVLFYNVDWLLSGDFALVLGDDGSDIKFSRIADPDIFDRYFYFKIPEGDISSSRLESVLGAINDRDRLLKIFTEYKSLGYLRQLLDRLNGILDEIHTDHPTALITTLFDIGDNLPEEEAFTQNERTLISIIFRNYLLKVDDTGTRKEAFLTSIKDTAGLYMPFLMVHREDGRHQSQSSPHKYVVDDGNLPDLKEACINKVQGIADVEIIFNNKDSFFIIYLWWKWDEQHKAAAFAEQHCEDDYKFVKLIRSACRTVTRSTGKKVSRHLELELKYLELILPLDYLKARLEGIEEAKFEQELQLGLAALRRAIKRRDDGKHGDDFDDE